MRVQVIALYPLRLSSLADKPGVRFRRNKKKKAYSTLVPCRIETSNRRSVAVPEVNVPEGTSAPLFKAQLTINRVPVESRRMVCVVLGTDAADGASDPEQSVLSPIFDDGKTMIFEFRRAIVLTVGDRKEVEARMVAVHPVTGVIGTKTVYRFNARYLGLTARCLEYLAGAIDLYPAPERHVPREMREVPAGEANLSFEPRRRANGANT